MRWWGDFSANKELKTLGEFTMEFEGGTRGDVFVYASGAPQGSKSGRFQYSFNGKSKLGGLRGRGQSTES